MNIDPLVRELVGVDVQALVDCVGGGFRGVVDAGNNGAVRERLRRNRR